MAEKKTSSANSTVSKQQAKELKRIRQFVKKASKRGYIFFDTKVSNDGTIPTSALPFDLPKSIKNPTKVTVNRLKKITKEYLYERALYVDPQTGETHSGKEGRRIERSRAGQKGAETRKRNRIPPPDVVLNLDIIDKLSELFRSIETGDSKKPGIVECKEKQVSTLADFFDQQVAKHINDKTKDIYEYASYLENKAEEINNYLESAMRASDQKIVELNIGAIATILNRGTLDQEQSDLFSDQSESLDTFDW